MKRKGFRQSAFGYARARAVFHVARRAFGPFAPAAWAPFRNWAAVVVDSMSRPICFNVSAQKDAVIWGRAAYKNGWRYDVVWNETSDFRDFILRDGRPTVGGDLQYEQYELSGGYSVNYRRSQFSSEG